MKRHLNVLLVVLSAMALLLSGCTRTKNQQEFSEETNGSNVAKPSENSGESSSLVTNSGIEIELSALAYRTEEKSSPVVSYISDITPEAMVEIYNAFGWSPEGKVAVKLSTGEPPASNYLRPELIADVVQLVDGAIVECNTAYGGSRAQTRHALSSGGKSRLYSDC